MKILNDTNTTITSRPIDSINNVSLSTYGDGRLQGYLFLQFPAIKQYRRYVSERIGGSKNIVSEPIRSVIIWELLTRENNRTAVVTRLPVLFPSVVTTIFPSKIYDRQWRIGRNCFGASTLGTLTNVVVRLFIRKYLESVVRGLFHSLV